MDEPSCCHAFRTDLTITGSTPEKPSAINDIPIIRIEQNSTVLEMAISCTKFVTQGKEQQIISLKNIHSVLERNEMEAWQKLDTCIDA